MNPAAGLKVLGLPFDHETTDVLIGSYLSRDAARDDHRAALGCGAYLHGAIVISKDLAGDVSIDQSDHLVREGAQALGTVGFLAGLVILPVAPITAGLGAITGGATGGILGEGLHLLIQSQAARKTSMMLPLGCATLILAYPHSSAPRVEPAVTRAVTTVVSQAQGHHVQALRQALAGARHDMAAASDADRSAHRDATGATSTPAISAGTRADRADVPAPRGPGEVRERNRVGRDPSA